jgi:hypothetical protein
MHRYYARISTDVRSKSNYGSSGRAVNKLPVILLRREILSCSGSGRRTGPRECIVEVGNKRTIHALSAYARPGDLVTVSKMVTRVSGSTVYEIITTGSN